jgi:hypothetical protein
MKLYIYFIYTLICIERESTVITNIEILTDLHIISIPKYEKMVSAPVSVCTSMYLCLPSIWMVWWMLFFLGI